MVYSLSTFQREFKQVVVSCHNLEKVAREEQLEPRLLQAMKQLSHKTSAAVQLKAAVLWREFEAPGWGLEMGPFVLVEALALVLKANK